MSSEWVNTKIAQARKREVKEGKRVLFPVRLVKECNFLDLIERPGLWRAGLRWVVLPGMRPEAAV